MVDLTRGCEFPISEYDVEVVNFLLLMYPEQPVSVAVRLLRTSFLSGALYHCLSLKST